MKSDSVPPGDLPRNFHSPKLAGHAAIYLAARNVAEERANVANTFPMRGQSNILKSPARVTPSFRREIRSGELG